MTSAEAVRRVLADAPGDGVCNACLARVCGASLSEIRQITDKLLEDNSCGHGAICARCGCDVAITLRRCMQCQSPIGLGELASRFKDGIVHASCLVLMADTDSQASQDRRRPVHKPPRSSVRGTAARGLVVVVDDDISVRRGLSRLLAAVGYRVSAFGSGRELLEWVGGQTPSCLVLDVRMPGLSGIAVHEALRAAGQRIPVVFITGDVEIPATTRATGDASVAILSKPVDEEELFATVHRLITCAEDHSDLSSSPER
jgi:CheY-like chemotaxis protein